MVRVAFVFGMTCVVLPSPALAMPNAFWIFGFHVPGKQGPKSDLVMKESRDQHVVNVKKLADNAVDGPFLEAGNVIESSTTCLGHKRNASVESELPCRGGRSGMYVFDEGDGGAGNFRF